ncbi:MAG: hypothetical protein PVI57_20185 [Gemmatimonadota bacterium]
MDALLEELKDKWMEVSQYEDIDVLEWTPGDPLAGTCPDGCDVVDTGWQALSTETAGIDVYRRTVFCRDHSFARIYVITAAAAGDLGWEPPPES